MKLNEKICYCRRKAGLSQEALAERSGVSRQAISKWETGEASPDIPKLPLLASTFGVTADWLLSEEDPAGDAPPEPTPEAPSHPYAPTGAVHINAVPDWVDKLPGFLGRLIRQYGWLVAGASPSRARCSPPWALWPGRCSPPWATWRTA